MNNEEVQEEPIENADEMAETIAGLTVDEYEKIRKEALEKAKNTKHQWVQKGRGKITCTSCPFPHTSFIPMNKSLVGIDNSGLPILKDLV